MAFIKLDPINGLEHVSNAIEGKILFAENGELKTTDISSVKSEISSGIKGEAIPSTIPTPWASGQPNLYEKYDVKVAGTFTNFKDSGNNPIVISLGDLNGNLVQLWAKNGISEKVLKAMPQPTQFIPSFTGSTFPLISTTSNPIQRTHEDSIWQLTPGQTALVTDIPSGTSLIWKRLAVSGKMLSDLKTEVFPPKNIALTVTNEYLQNNGVSLAHANYRTSLKVNIQHNIPYRYRGRTTSDAGAATAATAIVAYNVDGSLNSVIKATYDSSVSGDFEFIITDVNIKYIRCCSRDIAPMTLVLLDELIPESKVAGLVELKETVNDFVGGETVLSNEKVAAYINSTGGLVSISTWSTTSFINVLQGIDYYYRGNTTPGGGTSISIAGYDANDVFVANILVQYNSAVNGDYKFTITNANIKKIRACSVNSVPVFIVLKKFIAQERIEGFSELVETVNDIANSMGVGAIATGKSWAPVGDSITEFDLGARGYQSYIKDSLTFTGYTNFGFSGRSLTNAVDRASILDGIANIGNFGIYTIFAGTNDFKLNRPIGTTNDYINATGGTTFYGALRATINLLYTKNPACQIYIASPLRRNNDGYSSFSTNTAGHKLEDYRNAMEWTAKREALIFIDLYNESGITDRNLSIYTSDGLHPTTEGHKLISKRFLFQLKNKF